MFSLNPRIILQHILKGGNEKLSILTKQNRFLETITVANTCAFSLILCVLYDKMV